MKFIDLHIKLNSLLFKILIAVLIVFSLSCTHKDEDEKYEELIGVWISRYDGSRLIISPDETFVVNIADGSGVTIEGKLWHEKGNIYFLNKPDAVRCVGDTGIYQFVLVGYSLEFSVTKDKCKERISHLTNIWVRKSEKRNP